VDKESIALQTLTVWSAIDRTVQWTRPHFALAMRIHWRKLARYRHNDGDGDPCGPRSDASAMYHVRTAPSVTVPSLPPARAHGTSFRSAYATLGYRWLLSTNIWNVLILHRVLRPRRICDIYDLFAPFINLLTYLLTYNKSVHLSLRSS